ncbi:MAG: LCP family protein [Clostridia bacterium]|nr:LCP family protein [Clostridia bacterium]
MPSKKKKRVYKKKKNRVNKKVKLAAVISMLSLLGILLVALVGGGLLLLNWYNQMNYQEIGDNTMDQEFLDASLAMQNGVSLDTILKDPNHRFTLQDVEDLKLQYQDWLSSQSGLADSDPNNTLNLWKDPPADEPLPEEAEKLINILCLGTDERAVGSRGRTDTIMMITINTEKRTITMTSFLRDMYLKLAGTNSYNKLNAAYVYGGVGGVRDTLYDYFGLEFDNYAQVNFSSFEKVIDAIGGIDIELSDKEVTNLVKHTALDGGKTFVPEDHFLEGTKNTYHLNGKYALRLCRDRYANDNSQGDGDFGRTERQRRVLTKVIEKAQTMSFGQLMDLIPIVLPMITTDLTVADCANLLASVGTSYSSYTIQTCHIPDSGTYNYASIDGMSVLSVNFEKNKKMLHSLIFD